MTSFGGSGIGSCGDDGCSGVNKIYLHIIYNCISICMCVLYRSPHIYHFKFSPLLVVRYYVGISSNPQIPYNILYTQKHIHTLQHTTLTCTIPHTTGHPLATDHPWKLITT